MYLFDSDICSYLINDRYSHFRQRYLSVHASYRAASAITQAEVWYGLEKTAVGLRRRLAAEDFFDSLSVLAWPVSATKLYGDLRARLERRGTPIGDHDVMIAAHAIALDATLVTNNTRHFERIGNPLRLENWA